MRICVSSRRRHTRWPRDWSSDVCSSDLLKLFRREPAISMFDWLFTPTHTSSPHFSTYVGSRLRSVLPDFHAGHRWITWFRVYAGILDGRLSLAFASAPCVIT